MKSQGCEEFFDLLKGLVYPEFVKEFWIFTTAFKHQITSYVMGHKISISNMSIEKNSIMMDMGKGVLICKLKRLSWKRLLLSSFRMERTFQIPRIWTTTLKCGSKFFRVVFTKYPQQTTLTTSTLTRRSTCSIISLSEPR